MAKLDWDKAKQEKLVRERGAVRARPEAKGVSYPRPAEPSKDDLRAAAGKKRRLRPPKREVVEVDGRTFRTVPLDNAQSARNLALRKSREADRLREGEWVTSTKPSGKKGKKRRRR